MHITSCDNHLPVICQNDEHRETPTLCSSGLSGNIAFSAVIYVSFKKADIEVIDEMGTAEKGAPP